MATYGKQHDQNQAIDFAGLIPLKFSDIVLAASQASTVVQDAIQVPCNFKIFYICANLTGTPAGTCSINVVAGTAAEGAVGTADVLATNGVKAVTDTALTMTANTLQRIKTTVVDAIYPTTLPLTLRTVTNGSAGGNASQTFTYAGTPTDGDSNGFVIGGTTVTVNQATANSLTQQAAAAVAVLQASVLDETFVFSSNGAVVTATARTAGTGPNSITTTATTTAHATLTAGGATLAGGTAPCTLKVTLLGKFVDPNPTKPLFNSDGSLSF